MYFTSKILQTLEKTKQTANSKTERVAWSTDNKRH